MGVASLVMELENTRYLKNKQMEWSDFFHAGTNSEEPKSWFNDFWVGVVKKWPLLSSSWDPKICILRVNLWIELIF